VALENRINITAQDLASKMGLTIKSRFEFSLSYILLSIVRVLQFALAITVCALYGVDLDNARAQGKYLDSKWVSA